MAIAATDIKILASSRMVDAADGGGQMTGSALQDGAENNVFPDLSSTDRAFGRLALRKVYPAVLNSGTDALLGAHVILEDMPDDSNVTAWSILGNSQTEDRAGVLARLEQTHWASGGATGLEWAGSPRLGTRIKSNGGVTPLSVGSVVMADGLTGTQFTLVTGLTEILSSDGTFSEGFSSGVAGDRVFAVTLDGAAVTAGATRLAVPSPTSPRVASTRPVTGTLAAGDTYCDVDTLLAAVVPKQLGASAGTVAQIGIDAGAVRPAGRAVAFRSGDGLVVHHTGIVAAATYSNGNTINCGRTGLASVRLIGNNGVRITTGFTANLAAGTISVTDISGWSQPVTVKHTIEEVVACSRTGYPEVSGGSGGSGSTSATAPFTLTESLTMYCGRPNVGSIRVISKTGQDITDLTYTTGSGLGTVTLRHFDINLAAGTVVFSGSSVIGVVASHSPVTLVSSGTYTALGTPSTPQATLNRITFNRPLTKAFPSGTLISSMLLLGDLLARAGQAFAQESWGNVWSDERIGSAVAAQYQQASNPIAVTNAGAITERWAFIFLTSTTFRLVGQTLGQIATGDINTAFAPTNPATGVPYFSIAAAGWGTWAAGNVLRLNTYGANCPIWVARATLPSAPSSTSDSLTIAVRGDIDA